MIGMRHAAWLFLLAPACFHPSYDHPACGPNGECPGGLTCSARLICEGISGEPLDAGSDALVTGVDAQQCFGTGLLHICLEAVPMQPLTISNAMTIDTDSSAMCTPIMSGGSNYCVVAATTITIDAKLRATGTRPLVLLASNSITATTLIDVGSHRGAIPEIGAGADPVACTAGTLSTTGGGGAGGSFLGLGGVGGSGGASGAGGVPGATASAITALRGGCSGQDGSGASKGAKGHGGGAVYLIAGNTIDVKGGINAAGEGGTGGVTNLSGGGGGGAGGMIAFDAPTIIASGLILANGGGGGEGSGTATTGASGSDPSAITAASGGSGNVAKGGDGGNGSAGPSAGPGLAGAIGVVDGGGGGGGGGGAGLVKAPAGANLGTQVSPAATP